jgi:hypothetical protein
MAGQQTKEQKDKRAMSFLCKVFAPLGPASADAYRSRLERALRRNSAVASKIYKGNGAVLLIPATRPQSSCCCPPPSDFRLADVDHFQKNADLHEALGPHIRAVRLGREHPRDEIDKILEAHSCWKTFGSYRSEPAARSCNRGILAVRLTDVVTTMKHMADPPEATTKTKNNLKRSRSSLSLSSSASAVEEDGPNKQQRRDGDQHVANGKVRTVSVAGLVFSSDDEVEILTPAPSVSNPSRRHQASPGTLILSYP